MDYLMELQTDIENYVEQFYFWLNFAKWYFVCSGVLFVVMLAFIINLSSKLSEVKQAIDGLALKHNIGVESAYNDYVKKVGSK